MILRPYQEEAVNSIFREWEDNASTLAVMPTGSGKSLVFAEVIRRIQPSRAMVVAHRKELIHQAQETIERHADLDCEIEMADMVAATNLFHRTPVVIASIQTLISGSQKRRYERFAPDDFGLLVIDEFHHAVGASYRAVLDHFRQNAELKVLGVTATPDRLDEEALGQICDTVAFDYEIIEAIRDGYLVPVEQQMVSIQGLDFSQIRTTAGDLNGADLAAVMENEKTMQGVVGSAIEIAGDKRTILFACSVAQARVASEIFNRHKSGLADFVCGRTPDEERTKILKSFSNGSTQILCNCGVATEGFDVPAAEVCIMARPTKSRALYAQMAGRCTRPLPGIIDGLETADERKDAIAASPKPTCLIVDFCGNSGRHKLMTTADILGGKMHDEVVELAARKAAAGRGRMDEFLDEAEEEIAAAKRLKEIAEEKERERLERLRKSRVVAHVSYAKRAVNPFDAFELSPVRERGWDSGKSLSEKQRAILLKSGIDPDSMPYGAARQLLNEQFRRWNGHLATLKQCALLKRFGYETHDLPMKEASRLIDTLAKNGWKKPVEVAA